MTLPRPIFWMRNFDRRDVSHSSLGSLVPPRVAPRAFSTSGAGQLEPAGAVISLLGGPACDVRGRRANRRAGDYAWQLAGMRQVMSGAVPSVVLGRCEVPAGSRHAQIGGAAPWGPWGTGM